MPAKPRTLRKKFTERQRYFIRRWYPLGYSIDALAESMNVSYDRVRSYIAHSLSLTLRKTSPVQSRLPPLPKYQYFPQRDGTKAARPGGNGGRRDPEIVPTRQWDSPICPGWRVHGDVAEHGWRRYGP